MEKLINSIPMFCWAALGAVCLAGVIIAGAWWHIGTAAVCAVMAVMVKPAEEEK